MKGWIRTVLRRTRRNLPNVRIFLERGGIQALILWRRDLNLQARLLAGSVQEAADSACGRISISSLRRLILRETGFK